MPAAALSPNDSEISSPSQGVRSKVDVQARENSPLNTSMEARLWRPAAQRNLRNQWPKVNFLVRDWRAAAASARSHATDIVNSYLSQVYMNGKDFGVLSDMPDIQKKARLKLLRQQELCKGKLLSSYRDMVTASVTMLEACNSMGRISVGTSLYQSTEFASSPQRNNEVGDFNQIPVFRFYTMPFFEEVCWEIVRMFISELILKRLLVLEFLGLYDEKVATTELKWSDELYNGEFHDLRTLSLYSDDDHEPLSPHIRSKSCSSIVLGKHKDSTTLQVYLVTWLKDVNIDNRRVDEILTMVANEMHINFP